MNLYFRKWPVFFPLAWLYDGLTSIRNWFFDKGVFESTKFEIPVISVGNITAGGTGKTPFILFLLKKLKSDFGQICVVSRGYGRKTKGLQIVSDQQTVYLQPQQAGDEPCLIARKFPGIPVIVSEDRKAGIEYAVSNFNCDLVLLDDAFQHRRVYRACDIVLINSSDDIEREKLLPVGNLRENIKNLRRADIIVLTKKDGAGPAGQIKFLSAFTNRTIFTSSFSAKCLVDKDLKPISNQDWSAQKFLGFAGIANPVNFQKSLTQFGIMPEQVLSFRDHESYDKNRVKLILQKANAIGCRNLVTTEKDIVKLKSYDFTGYSLYALSAEIEVDMEEKFLENIKGCIEIKKE